MALSEAAVGALISGAATVAGAGVQGYASGRMNKRAEKFNREEAATQRAWNESMAARQNVWNNEMWQKMTDYDNPVNSVQRLRDAGLNPMFYGLDGNTAAQAQPAAQPLGYERASAPVYANPFAGAADVATKVAQVANIQADTAKKTNENLTEVQRRERLIADIDLAKQELSNMKAQEGLTKSQQEEIDKRIGWLDRLNEATVAEKEASAALNKSQKNRIDELLENEKLLQVKELKDFEVKWSKIRAEIGKIAKETGLLEKDIENYALNHASNGFMGTGLSLQNILRGVKNIKPRPGNENVHGEGNDWQDMVQSGQ